jgi:hypothetical protein
MEETNNFSISCTFGPVAENGTGKNEKIGKDLEHGFTKEELEVGQKNLNVLEVETKLFNLGDLLVGEELPEDMPPINSAYLLVMKGVVGRVLKIHKKTAHDLTNELKNDKMYDKKKYMRGAVKNCWARICCCVADFSQKADYTVIPVKGTVHNFKSLPLLNLLRGVNEIIFGQKAKKFYCELNKYHHNKAGIGFHGDAERKAVICYKSGEKKMKLKFQWYYRHKRIGKMFEVEIGEGDGYVMSEFATGYNWKCSSFPTIRHSSGREKSKHIN